MGSLGDHDDDENQPSKRNSTFDGMDDETQPFDSQYSPPPSETGEGNEGKDFDELDVLQSTMPFDDTVPLEDVFETQVLNFVGETQVLDDHEAVENVGTQLLDESDSEVVLDTDGEETDTTQVLGDTEELSDDDSVKRVGIYPVDEENNLSTPSEKQDSRELRAESDGLNDKKDISGSVRADFTSVRAASLRASGLAARSMASKGTNNELCSTKSDALFTKLHAAEDNGISTIRDSSIISEEADDGDFPGVNNEQIKGLRIKSNCRTGYSLVRRLFTEDTLTESKEPNESLNNADGNEIAGLSYIDSQEPGDLSQANAIEFVDRFIKSDIMDFDQEDGLGRSTGGKSKPVSSAKGTQSLVKRTNLQIAAGKRGVFDWDDSLEDEGGGEFFSKKKEALFDTGGQRKISFPRKGSAISNSGLLLHNSKCYKTENVTERKSKKKLTTKLDEQLNNGPSDGMEATNIDKDVPEMLNVGFDTQIAAEAMEALCFGLDVPGRDSNDTDQGAKNICELSLRGEKTKRLRSKKGGVTGVRKTSSSPSPGVITRNSKKTTTGRSRKKSAFPSQKQAEKPGRDSNDTDQGAKNICELSLRGEKTKRLRSKKGGVTGVRKTSSSPSPGVITRNSKKTTTGRSRKKSAFPSQKQAEKVTKECDTEVVKEELKKAMTNGEGCFVTKQIKNKDKICSDDLEQIEDERAQKRNDTDEVDTCHVVASSSASMSVKKRRLEEEFATLTPVAHRTRQSKVSKFNDTNGALTLGAFSYSRGKRTCRKLSTKSVGIGGLHASVNQSVVQGTKGQSLGKLKKRSIIDALSASVDLGNKRQASSDWQSDGSLFQCSMDKGGSGNAALKCDSVDRNVISKNAEASIHLEVSPGDRCKPSGSSSTTPLNRTTPINDASPICMGDEYFKQSCRKNLSRSLLAKEVYSLISNGPEPMSTMKDSRRRRDMASVQALFSHHLDEDIIKQQKKILARLGASVACSISEATHFVTDKFVRTRNMLEAIAFGKPVVTHLWLESCGQASCFIDERNYIVRDAKKEKEFGFSLPVSLARACQRPLLQGQKVLITPNTKPCKEILANLVRAVHGLAVERIGRSALKGDNFSDDLLVLSCEEDYATCLPFLEKGAAVYSSELLLNGIVTQKLEFERHRLFADHVKKTRSTIWLKQDKNQYLPVSKRK